MASRGQPKKISNEEQMIALWKEFCDDIIEEGFATIPSQTAFCRWLKKNYSSIDRKTIYNTLNKYFPDIKKEFEQIQSDVITEGGMLGKYQPTMSIFALKNWCKWTDKQETTTISSINSEVRAEVNSLVEEFNELNADKNESN